MTILAMKDEEQLDMIQQACRNQLAVLQIARVIALRERHAYRVKPRVGKAAAKRIVYI